MRSIRLPVILAEICGTMLFAAPPASAQSPLYVMSIPAALLPEGETVTLPVLLDNFGSPLAGWTLGVCHDPAMLDLLSAQSGPTMQAIKNGSFADFNEIAVYIGGYTQGVVICITPCATLPPGAGYSIMLGSYAPLPGVTGTTEICFCNTLGTPPVTTVVVAQGASVVPSMICGEVAIIPPGASFVRGDANDDGAVNIADPIWLLSELFSGGPHTDCDGANDANSDGTLDIADPLFLLADQFGAGPPPAAPYPDCGSAADPAECATFTSCP